MGLFEDLEYPDNEERGQRASELAYDISTGLLTLASQRTTIDVQLRKADEAIRAAYAGLEADLPELPIVDVKLGDSWELELSESLEPFVVFGLASYGLERASVAFLLAEGRIGEAALTRLVGLPNWFKFGKFVGGVAAVVAVAAIVDSITGAIKRNKLRDMIHEQIEPRKKVQKARLINDMVEQSLGSVIMTFEALKGLGLYTQKQLADALNALLEKEKEKIAAITDVEVANSLSQLDSNRGSWTKEDS